MRRTEGEALAAVLAEHLDRIEALTAKTVDLAQARAAMERALLRIRVAERRHREGPRQRR